MSIEEKRFTEMEMRIAYQEKTLTDLSDVITTLWKKIDALERQLRRIDADMQAMDGAEGPVHQKPPHY